MAETLWDLINGKEIPHDELASMERKKVFAIVADMMLSSNLPFRCPACNKLTDMVMEYAKEKAEEKERLNGKSPFEGSVQEMWYDCRNEPHRRFLALP